MTPTARIAALFIAALATVALHASPAFGQDADEPQVIGDVMSGTPPEPLPQEPPVGDDAGAIDFKYESLPPFAGSLDGTFAGRIGDSVIIGGGEAGDVHRLADGQWGAIGSLPAPLRNAAAASGGDALYVIGGEIDGAAVAEVRALRIVDGALVLDDLPDLPTPLASVAATVMDGKLYAAGSGGSDGTRSYSFTLDLDDIDAGWATLEAPADRVVSPAMVTAIERIFLLVGGDEPAVWTWSAKDGWLARTAPPRWPEGARTAAVGPSHVYVLGGGDGRILAYHAITDRWFDAGPLGADVGDDVAAVSMGGSVAVFGNGRATRVTPQPFNPPFPLIDYLVVGAYLLSMLGLGWYFVKRDGADDYFRGGRHVPWWATGMSLFATGASAISLMAMPGKSYSGNWEFFIVSVFSLMALPIGLFILAPLVRRLNIKTANEYLERRFGVVARLFASVVFIFAQTATRFAAIMLLPALALEAIAGVPTVWGIVIMGTITTLYTFLGGLSAVIWTDTIQGLVMCAAVAGCLILASLRLDEGVAAGFGAAFDFGKFTMLDLSPSLLRLTTMAWLINVLVASFGGISDQNFVQRVQATRTLGDARRAVATQIFVAVPINVLLFGLGTALWLFYRSRPEQLSPAMQTDSVFPFFVAQQLPVGLSGLVMAALLAATMSTVSSAICSVSDLGVNDFYRRFNPRATDRSSLVVGRTLTAVVGVVGTLAAIRLDQLGSPSVWDLALLLTGLISNGILGLFWLGLLTRRANEVGAMIGVVCGMATVWWFQSNTGVTFLVYQAIGAGVAITVGYVTSLLLPINRRDTRGLTVFDRGDPEAPATAGWDAA